MPLMMTVQLGIIFGKVYEIWGFVDLSGRKAMETAWLITFVVAGVYALYFLITYRIACDYVVCYGGKNFGGWKLEKYKTRKSKASISDRCFCLFCA